MLTRTATVSRKTGETDIKITLDLDGSGQANVSTGVGFLDHMLELLAKHALIDLRFKGGTTAGRYVVFQIHEAVVEQEPPPILVMRFHMQHGAHAQGFQNFGEVHIHLHAGRPAPSLAGPGGTGDPDAS